MPIDTVKCDIAELPPSKEVGKGKRVFTATCLDEKQVAFVASTFSKTIADNLKYARENGLQVKMKREGPNNYNEYRILQLMLVEGPEGDGADGK